MARDGQTSPTGTDARSARDYREHHVPRGPHRLYARDYPGAEPAILLLHGFPDNLHLYDRLVPQLAPRRVVVFDFLGRGASDKPSGYQYTAANQVGDLDAVIDQLQLTSVVLVAHDASGPPAIDWALEHPPQVAALVLLNTYYCRMPGLRTPEAIRLFSTPVIRSVARPVSRLFGDVLFRRMYHWQVGRFFRDPEAREQFVPLLYQQFAASPSTHEAFFGLNQACGPPLPPGRRPSRGCSGSPARSASCSAPPTPTSTAGWRGASTSCCPPLSCSCSRAPATTSRWTSRSRSPG